MAKIGRNDGCPCGSGQKFKACCLVREEALPQTRKALKRLKDVDTALIRELLRWAPGNVAGFDPYSAAPLGWDSHDGVAGSILIPWAVFHHRPLGAATAAETWLALEPRPLSAEEHTVLEAQRRAWLGLWQVRALGPKGWLYLTDLWTGERRDVFDDAFAAAPGDLLIARVSDRPEPSRFVGIYPAFFDDEHTVALAAIGPTVCGGVCTPGTLRGAAGDAALRAIEALYTSLPGLAPTPE